MASAPTFASRSVIPFKSTREVPTRLLNVIHYLLLPVLNLSLLGFVMCMNHAYIYPTSLPFALPFRIRGTYWFTVLYAGLCLSSVLVGSVNAYVVWVTVRLVPEWKRRWGWLKEKVLNQNAMVPWFTLVGFRFSSTGVGGGGRQQVVAGNPKWSFRMRRVPLWRIVAVLVLALVGCWGLLGSMAFRNFFRQKAWKGACVAGGGWELFAEITVMNGGRGVLYDGANAGKADGEKERWGTSSRVGFYSAAEEDEEGKYNGKWRWEYEMDLVRRYDLPWGLGRYVNGVSQPMDDEISESEITTRDILAFVLHDFRRYDSGKTYTQNQTLSSSSFPSSSMATPSPSPSGDHISPHFANFTNTTISGNRFANLTNTTISAQNISTTTTLTMSSSTSSTSVSSTTPLPTASGTTLTDLKKPWLSTADLNSKPIANPFPIFNPPISQPDSYRAQYPPLQKVVYYLQNSTYHATLTNTTAPGFPALEEWGTYDSGGGSGIGFGIQGWGMAQPGLGASSGSESGGDSEGSSWSWTNIAKLNGHRWRWDGFWPPGQQKVKNAGQNGDYGGLCLPPRFALRMTGTNDVGLSVVEVVGGGCGVVRVCGVSTTGGVNKGGGSTAGVGSGKKLGYRQGDEEWRAAGWKREVEDRWAIVIGLLAWEVERWAGCCVAGE